MWERYFTFRQRRSHGGSGLGLAIVKAILERQNAGYGVESSPGRGCLFWFELERSVQQDESI
ncbi:MAG: ATP-binding protein [Clostridium sp.]|nr:ATP-binding protein [Clostridium sp.]